MTNVKKLSEIEANPIIRNKTWFTDLDLLYGTSDLPEHNIGMPKGKISLMAGESGVGKSRLCIEIAKNFSTRYRGGIVLYFQTESPLEDFASWAKDNNQYDQIYCSGENRIDEMIKIIYQVKPKLIFIDSVNEIDEFENGNKKEARRLIKGVIDDSGNTIKRGLKQATYDMGAHTILLGQLNQDGKTIKGGTSLPHLVDIAFDVVKTERFKQVGIFRVKVGIKHRHGSVDGFADFMHTNDGVIEYLSYTPALNPAVQEYVAPAVQEYVAPVCRRVKALTKSGTCAVDANGQPDFYDPEYREHVANKARELGHKVDAYGNILPDDKRSLLTKLNQGVGKMFGL